MHAGFKMLQQATVAMPSIAVLTISSKRSIDYAICNNAIALLTLKHIKQPRLIQREEFNFHRRISPSLRYFKSPVSAPLPHTFSLYNLPLLFPPRIFFHIFLSPNMSVQRRLPKILVTRYDLNPPETSYYLHRDNEINLEEAIATISSLATHPGRGKVEFKLDVDTGRTGEYIKTLEKPSLASASTSLIWFNSICSQTL
jgi:hypothetical protein